MAQESEAARTSRLFSTTSAREQPEIGPALAAVSAATGTRISRPEAADRSRLPSEHAGPQTRLSQWSDRSAHRQLRPADNPASSYIVQAGTVIPAALITGIQSDLPGLITAQVTENVYDSPTGRFLLVPQGAKLIGTRQPGVLRPIPRPARLEPDHFSERPIDRA